MHDCFLWYSKRRMKPSVRCHCYLEVEGSCVICSIHPCSANQELTIVTQLSNTLVNKPYTAMLEPWWWACMSTGKEMQSLQKGWQSPAQLLPTPGVFSSVLAGGFRSWILLQPPSVPGWGKNSKGKRRYYGDCHLCHKGAALNRGRGIWAGADSLLSPLRSGLQGAGEGRWSR